ncbi:MAG: hypothetical protein WAZ19_02455 [Anaerolineae bacterium]
MIVGDSIWNISINKFHRNGESFFDGGGDNGVKVVEHKILGVNDNYIVIDDFSFSTITHRVIDFIVTDVRVGNHFMGDGVFVSLISTSPPDKQLLERMVYSAESEVKRRYGWLTDFMVGLDNLIEEYDNNTTEVS